jgi:hypothetical protein
MTTFKEAVQAQDWKKALSKARQFFFGLTPEEKRYIEIAADYMNGKGAYYERMQIDCKECLEKAKQILINKAAKMNDAN